MLCFVCVIVCFYCFVNSQPKMLRIFLYSSFFIAVCSEKTVQHNVTKINNTTSETLYVKVNNTNDKSALRQIMLPLDKESFVFNPEPNLISKEVPQCEYSEILQKIWTVLSTYLSHRSVPKAVSPDINKIRSTMLLIKTYIESIPKIYQNIELINKLKEVEDELNKDMTVAALDNKYLRDTLHYNPTVNGNLKTDIVFRNDLPSAQDQSCREAFERLIQTARDAYLQVVNNPLCNREIPNFLAATPDYLNTQTNQQWWPSNNPNQANILPAFTSLYSIGKYPQKENNGIFIGSFPFYKTNNQIEDLNIPSQNIVLPDNLNPQNKHYHENLPQDNVFIKDPYDHNPGKVSVAGLPFSQYKLNNEIFYPQNNNQMTSNNPEHDENIWHKGYTLIKFPAEHYINDIGKPLNENNRVTNNELFRNYLNPQIPNQGKPQTNNYPVSYDINGKTFVSPHLPRNSIPNNILFNSPISADASSNQFVHATLSPLNPDHSQSIAEFIKIIPEQRKIQVLEPKYDTISSYSKTIEGLQKDYFDIEKKTNIKKLSGEELTKPEVAKLLAEELYQKDLKVPINDDNLNDIIQTKLIQPNSAVNNNQNPHRLPVNFQKDVFVLPDFQKDIQTLPKPSTPVLNNILSNNILPLYQKGLDTGVNQNMLVSNSDNVNLNPLHSINNQQETILQPDIIASGLSKSSSDITGTDLDKWQAVANLYKLNSLPNTADIIELTYLLKRPKPVVYQPFYLVKYRMPYRKFLNNMQNVWAIKPYLRNNPTKLVEEVISEFNVTEISPALKGYTKSDILKFVSNNGALIDTKVIGENTKLSEQIKIIQDLNSNLRFNTKNIVLNNQTTKLLNQIKRTYIGDQDKNIPVKDIFRSHSIPDQISNPSPIIGQEAYLTSNTYQQSTLNNNINPPVQDVPAVPVLDSVVTNINASNPMLIRSSSFPSALPLVSSNILGLNQDVNPKRLGMDIGNSPIAGKDTNNPVASTSSDNKILPLLYRASINEGIPVVYRNPSQLGTPTPFVSSNNPSQRISHAPPVYNSLNS